MSTQWMVFEYERRESMDPCNAIMEHYCTIILEQPDVSKFHYYRTQDLHIHKHGQLSMHRVDAYAQALEKDGFVRLKNKCVHENGRRPVKYYYICSKNENYVTREITVFNRFDDHPHLLEMAMRIPFQDMANQITGKWYPRLVKEEMKKGNARGNVRIDSGYSMLSRVDKCSVPGMNIPTRLVQSRQYDYIPPSGDEYDEEKDEDCTFETTMLNNIQDATYLSDNISIITGEQLIHNDEERNRTWATKLAEETGASTKYLRSDNGSVFCTGDMQDFTTRQVMMHRDVQNDKRKGASDVICISVVVPVTFEATGETVEIRIGLGLYNKQGCGDVAEKLALISIPSEIVTAYMREHPTRSDHVEEGQVACHVMKWRNNRDVVEQRFDEEWKAQWAHADKSVFYSFYMHVIIHMIIPTFGKAKAVLYEAIYATALTTSQLGWKKGCEYAIQRKGNGKNFIINWIEGLRENHQHIGIGGYCRSMNSRRFKQYPVWKMYISIYNLMRACEESDHLQPSEILKNMEKPAYFRRTVGVGLENVGMFQAQQLVHIVTLVNLMKNKNVTDHIGVAEGTETYDRLMEMDPNMRLVVDCILPVLSHALGIPCLRVLENIFCEALRWYAGGYTNKYTKHDIILKGMELYQMRNGNLYKGMGGDTMLEEDWMVFDTFDGEFYNPLIKWWTMNANLPDRVLGDETEMILVSEL